MTPRAAALGLVALHAAILAGHDFAHRGLGVIANLGLSRYRAIHGGEVGIRYFRTYDEGEQPARLHLLARGG